MDNEWSSGRSWLSLQTPDNFTEGTRGFDPPIKGHKPKTVALRNRHEIGVGDLLMPHQP